jgi:hypothetical protein
MASLLKVRDGIATRIKTVPGLRVAEGGHALDNITPPAAIVMPGDNRTLTRPLIEYDQTMGGSARIVFTVMLLVSRASDRAGQLAIDAYLDDSGDDSGDDKSVKAAIEADLAPLVVDGEQVADYVEVTEASHYGFAEMGGVAYFGANLIAVART